MSEEPDLSLIPPGEPTPHRFEDGTALEQQIYETAFHAARDMVAKGELHSQVEEANQMIAEKDMKLHKTLSENNHASRQIFDLTEKTSALKDENDILRPLADRAAIDDLTKIKNRFGIREAYKQLVSDHLRHARRGEFSTAILYIDLDGFKDVNDRLGHDKGDRLLRYIASRFEGRLQREADEIGRIGGDEFLALLPDTDIESAQELAESLREIVKYGAGELDGDKTNVGASIGIALLDPSKDFDSMIKYADQAMYEAKRQGKDRVVVFNGNH